MRCSIAAWAQELLKEGLAGDVEVNGKPFAATLMCTAFGGPIAGATKLLARHTGLRMMESHSPSWDP